MTDIQIASLLVFFTTLFIAMASLIIYDIWIYRKYGLDATISRAMKRLGELAPIFPFIVGLLIGLLIGILAGHFWWSQAPITINLIQIMAPPVVVGYLGNTKHSRRLAA